MRIALKYALVAVLSLPVAVFFAGDTALSIVGKDVPFIDQILVTNFLQILIVSFLVAWGVVAYWAARVPSIREAAARTCRAFALAAFLLPVASIVFAITSPDPSDEYIFVPDGTFIAFCFIFGGILGLLGRIASDNLTPSSRKRYHHSKDPLW